MDMREASDLSAKPIMHAAPGPTFALARTYPRTGASRNAEKWRIRGRSAVTDGPSSVDRTLAARWRVGEMYGYGRNETHTCPEGRDISERAGGRNENA